MFVFSLQSIPNAVSTLAFFYQTGLGGAVSQDVAKAIELYEQGIEMGSTQAMVNLGHMLEKGYLRFLYFFFLPFFPVEIFHQDLVRRFEHPL